MDQAPKNVLFLCNGNAGRSIMSEVIMNSMGRGKYTAYSAGSQPTGIVNPYAIELLQKNRLPIDGLRSKNWDEFAQPGAPKLDFVFTVCDETAGEVCPIWPGQPVTAHWGIDDPSLVEGDDELKRRAFFNAYAILQRRIELFLSLPLSKLDALAIQTRLNEIGRN